MPIPSEKTLSIVMRGPQVIDRISSDLRYFYSPFRNGSDEN
jgi:hypothetical protein